MASSTPASIDMNAFTIGWICAVRVEWQAALRMLDERFENPSIQPAKDDNVYTLGRIGKHYVVVVLLAEYGEVDATSCLVDMVRTFSKSLRFGLMVGIAGGLPCPYDEEGHPCADGVDVRLGDIVIARPNGSSPGVIHYGKGKDTSEGFVMKGVLNKAPTMLMQSAYMLGSDIDERRFLFLEHFNRVLENSSARNIYRRPSHDRLYKADYVHPSGAGNCAACDPEAEQTRRPRDDTRPLIHFGTIATGTKVVKNAEKRERIRRGVEGALCVEMEAGGVMGKFPCLVIRGVCDYSDSHKNDEWQPLAAMNAASFAKELIIKLPKDDVNEQELAQNTFALLGALSQQIKDMGEDVALLRVKMLHRNKEDAEALSDNQRRCLQALKTTPYAEFKNVNPVAIPETCNWVLRSFEYGCWRYTDSQNLLCISADPGAGKSVLARTLIDKHLDIHTIPVSVCHFFFKDCKRNLAMALSALLHQLFTKQPGLLGRAMLKWGSLNEDEVEKGYYAKLQDIFMAVAADETLQPTVCVLDALDECQPKLRPDERFHSPDEAYNPQEELEKDLLKLLRDVQDLAPPKAQATSLKLLVTCCPHSGLWNKIRGLAGASRFSRILLQDTTHDESIRGDISTFVKSKVQELALETNLPSEVHKRVLDKISAADNRTYLWPHLVIADLKSQFEGSMTPDDFDIRRLPSAVNKAYRNILTRIKPEDVADARAIFKLIVGASRLLSAWEMGLAFRLAVCNKLETRLDALIMPEILQDKIRVKCGLFVIVQDGLVHLFHHTAREFLLQQTPNPNDPGSRFCFTMEDAESTWVRVCIRFLVLDEDPNEWAKSAFTNHLREYVSQNWVRYLERMPPASRAELENSVYLLYAERFEQWCTFFWEPVVPWIHRPDPYLPIHAAAFNGHTNVLRKLVQEGKANARQSDDSGRTSLLWCSWEGQYESSRLLIELGAKVNATSKDHGTPLLVAALKGHLNIVTLLLENGANVNQCCGRRAHVQANLTQHPDQKYLSAYTGTALEAAALRGHRAIVELLLEKGSKSLGLALMSAARGGHLEVAKLLVKRGAKVRACHKTNFYGTTVQAAAQGGHLDVLLYLLGQGAKDRVDFGHFDTAIKAAAYCGHGQLVQILLDRQDYNDDFLMDALEAACRKDNVQAVEALAPLVRDIDRRSPSEDKIILDVAFWNCSPKAIQAICQNSANLQRNNPLARAASYGYNEVVKTLLEKGVDINQGDPLAKAAEDGHAEVVITLFNKGADLDQGSPLMHAAKNGHLEVVKILLESDEIDVNQGYPLLHAVESENVEIVRLLVEQGANTNAGRPLHVAVRKNNPEMVRILLDGGAKRDKKDDSGKTAFEVARSLRFNPVLDCFFEKDLDVISESSDSS